MPDFIPDQYLLTIFSFNFFWFALNRFLSCLELYA